MTAPPPPPTHSLRLHSRVALVAAYVLLAPVPLTVAWIVGAHFSDAAGFALLGLVGVASVGTLARRWTERLDVWPERLVLHAGWLPREVPLDAVESLALRPYDPRTPLTANPYLTAHIGVRGGAPVTLSNVPGAGSIAVFDALARRIADGLRRRLEAGEVLTFRDDARFPWGVALGVGGFGLALSFAFVGALATRRWNDALSTLRGIALAVAALVVFTSMLRHWRTARRLGGLVVSERGVRAVNDTARAARDTAGAPFRDDGAAWIPWASVRAARLEGRGLVVETAAQAEPLVLSAASSNVLPLYALLTARLAAR